MKTLTELSIEYALSSESRFVNALKYSELFSSAFLRYEEYPINLREMELLKIQFNEIFLPREEGDMFCGRVRYPLVGLSPEPVGYGYYCSEPAFAEALSLYNGYTDRINNLIEFWKERTTKNKLKASYPERVEELLPSDEFLTDSDVAFPLYRMGGTVLDYSLLLELGLDGLEKKAEDSQFSYVVPLLRGTIDSYCQSADENISRNLIHIRHKPPETFNQAIQLFWLYALHSGTWNYGRLDNILSPYLKKDNITDTEALESLCSLWKLMAAYANQYNNRVFIGGKGRSDEEVADRFALLAIEATRKNQLPEPQLSMRFYKGQSEELWESALDALGEGCTFPILYNDDVNIPSVSKAFRVNEDMAANYTPYGCGEYVLGHYSTGTPSGVINLLKALEDTLRNESYDINSFSDLWNAYSNRVSLYVEALAIQEKLAYDTMAKDAPLGFSSLLMSDCLERNLSAFGGGVRYHGGTLESYGNTNTSDSLHVINELVFKEKYITLGEMVSAMDANFAGSDELLDRCRQISKYGNDDKEADKMASLVHEHICRITSEQAKTVGLHSYLVVVINNSANTSLGMNTGASADGRLAGESMANANNPSPGSDHSGVTAFLNSLVKLKPDIHAGTVQNMKFSPIWFREMRQKLDGLLITYFAKGGTQAMITVVSPEDLRSAMADPSSWGHLMVRVGGFSVRFVELPREIQMEVLHRTLY